MLALIPLDCDVECIRDNESMFRTFDENDSRLLLADGVAGDDVVLFVRVGDVFGVDIGIDELFRLDAFSDPSFRMLCAESDRYNVDGETESVDDELMVVSKRARLPVLRLRLLFDGGPDGLFDATKLRPVGGFGAR